MKSISRLFLAGLLAMASLAAAPVASAVDLPLNFNTSDNRNVQIDNVVYFTKNTFNVTVDILQVNGSLQSFGDSGHTTYAKMKTAALATGYFVQVPGSDIIIHTRKHTEMKCSGSSTVIGYGFMNNALTFADGCALHALVMAKSNPH